MPTIIETITKLTSIFNNGACGRVQNIHELAPLILARYPGNILEIGAGHGQTTWHLLAAAVEYSRKVCIVDPWDGDYLLSNFERTIQEFKANHDNFHEMQHLSVLRSASQSQQAHDYITCHAPYAFAFIDGLMTAEGILSDLRAVRGAAVICVDDYNYSPRARVCEALSIFFNECNLYHHVNPVGVVHETYLVLREAAR